jgi:transposase InsO family protein
MDLFKLNGKWYLVMTDYYSRYPEAKQLTSLTTSQIIAKTKSIFSRHGVPETVVSDCGTQFHPVQTSEYSRFALEYGFNHVTSSPKYSQSNGMAESAVKTVKSLLTKNVDFYKGLMEYRSTPLENGFSPAELLMGRRIKTTLPMNPDRLLPNTVDHQLLLGKEEKRIQKQTRNYNKRHRVREMDELKPGEIVWVTDKRTWATVIRNGPGPRSYIVKTPTGELRRNSFHLTRSHTNIKLEPEDLDNPNLDDHHLEPGEEEQLQL